jgi:methyltransferase (TIGR00027 family)
MARLASGKASRTARMTAAIRYRHFLGGAEPRVFLDREAGLFLDWRTMALAAPTPVSDRAFGRLLGPVRAIEGEVLARARYVDDALIAGIADGLAQLIVLGAGFDATAQRMAGTALRVFEVDHPATQSEKRAILARNPQVRHEAIFVPVDFAQDDLVTALKAAGFDPVQRTLVSWLGVTMYLEQSVTVDTLMRLRSILSIGSEVIFDAYPRVEEMAAEDRPMFAALKAFTAARGEPMIGAFNTPAFKASMAGSGFGIAEILDGKAMRERWFREQPRIVQPPRSVLLLRLVAE